MPRAAVNGVELDYEVVGDGAPLVFCHELCRGIVVAGTGSGTVDRERWEGDMAQNVATLTEQGIAAFVDRYAEGPTRLQYRRKDPRGYTEFRAAFRRHSALGSALTIRGVILRRPTIFALEERLDRLKVPTPLVVGDEDTPCLEPALFMKRHIADAGLVVLPRTGHTVNLEEPELFNRVVGDFLHTVELGRWAGREGAA